MYYAGIGSRSTPPDVSRWMTLFAEMAAKHGYILRSGAAAGADTAFETGANNTQGLSEIYLPWKFFNNSHSTLYPPTLAARQLAATVHPRWKYLESPVKALIARNMHQVLGVSLQSPVKFVICWTSDCAYSTSTVSAKTGGTGSAILLASRMNIPVFNVAIPGKMEEAITYAMTHI